MALKLTVDKLDDVEEGFRDLYKKDGDVYKLQVEGAEDTGALKRAKQHEKEARQKAEDEVRQLSERVQELESTLDKQKTSKAKDDKDIEALEKSWQEKLEKRENELNSELESAKGSLRQLLVDNVASGIANEISEAPTLLLPHIRSRLKAEVVDGKPVTKVLDESGQPSAMTLDEFKESIVANPQFAPIITASKASGGGANGGGGGAPKGKKFGEMTAQELSELRQKDPAAYERLRDQHKQDKQPPVRI